MMMSHQQPNNNKKRNNNNIDAAFITAQTPALNAQAYAMVMAAIVPLPSFNKKKPKTTSSSTAMNNDEKRKEAVGAMHISRPSS